ncbi:MAG: head-tail adaptor protein [Sulfitobacter sp.]
MSAPRLNRALVLETPAELRDGAGGYVQGWVPVGTLWAEVTPRSGRETAQSGAPISRMAYRIIVRGAAVGSPERPTAQQRFRQEERILPSKQWPSMTPRGATWPALPKRSRSYELCSFRRSSGCGICRFEPRCCAECPCWDGDL